MTGSKLRIGISSGHFEWKGLREAFRRCRDDWQLDLLEVWSEQIGFPPDKETAASLKQFAGEFGVAISYHAPFVGQYDLAQSDPARSALVLRELIGVCGRIHAEFLIVHLGSNPDKATGLRGAMSAIIQNLALIERLHLKIAVEVVPSLWGRQVGDQPEDFERLFRSIDRPWLGLNLDYGHAQLNKNLDAFLDKLSGKVTYAHIQDTRGDLDEHLPYGMGKVDWKHALERTLAAGFRGPFVIEFPEFHGADKYQNFLRDIRSLAAMADAAVAGKSIPELA